MPQEVAQAAAGRLLHDDDQAAFMFKGFKRIEQIGMLDLAQGFEPAPQRFQAARPAIWRDDELEQYRPARLGVGGGIQLAVAG